MAAKKCMERDKDFWQNVADDSAYTLQAKNLVQITISHTVSTINMPLHLHRNSRWPSKLVGKVFSQKVANDSTCTPQAKVCSKSLYLALFLRY